MLLLTELLLKDLAVPGLFRQKVVERQADRLHGEILLLPRLSHSLILGILLAWVAVTIIWLANSQYARKETVQGWLEPASGVVRVYAERSGVIKSVLVSDGEKVSKGQPLFVVNGDRILEGGRRLESVLLNEYESQRKLLTAQIERAKKISSKKEQNLKQRIIAAKADLKLLEKQMGVMERRYALVAEQAGRYQKLRKSGHVSSANLDNVIAQKLNLESEREGLARNHVNLRNQVHLLESERSMLPDESANAEDQLRTRLSDLARQIAQIHGQRAYVVKASRPGVVSNLQVREGQQVQTTIPALSLVPEGQTLTAQLLVPVRSAGFLAENQPLSIRYDAFPYQKFGLYEGVVVEVSDTALLPDEFLHAPVPLQEPAYKVTASLMAPTVKAYGKEFSLKPGMTLSADVQLAERSLLQWLLEPLYSLRGRI